MSCILIGLYEGGILMKNALRDSINEVLTTYLKERKNESDQTQHRLSRLNIIRDAIYANMGERFKDKYSVKGSIGQFNNWAWIPWLKIALKDKNVHINTKEGYYLVYLFDEDMKGVYLSLNQGWTYFSDKYGNNATANDKVKKVSSKVRGLICPDSEKDYVTTINLNTRGKYGNGYESAHIIGKYYSAENLPSDSVLIKDLEEMLQIYNDLAAHMRNRTFKALNEELLLDIDDLYIEDHDEEEYQQLSNEYEVLLETKNYKSVPREKKKAVLKSNAKEYYPRDAKQSAIALDLANYECEYDPTLKTFTNRITNKNFVEAHHLIPISFHEFFDFDIDVPENIVALNPTTHRQIHHGIDKDKADILEKLFNQRKSKLHSVNLDISLDDLKDMYNI